MASQLCGVLLLQITSHHISTCLKFIKYRSHSYVPLQTLVGNIHEIYLMFGMIPITTITSATNYRHKQKFVQKERSNLSQ